MLTKDELVNKTILVEDVVSVWVSVVVVEVAWVIVGVSVEVVTVVGAIIR